MEATHFYHADTLPYWRKRKKMSNRRPAAVDEASLQQLAGLIQNYFHRVEGGGKNCIVEPFRRGDLDDFFAYPEDYSQHSIEWVDGEFGRRPHNPAFEVIYVYSQKEGSIDLNFRGSYKAIEPLQGMFAQAILKLDGLRRNQATSPGSSMLMPSISICLTRIPGSLLPIGNKSFQPWNRSNMSSVRCQWAMKLSAGIAPWWHSRC